MKLILAALFGVASALSVKRDWSCPTLISGCTKTYLVVGGDACDAVASKNGITTSNFMSLNPSIAAGCGNMYAGCAYCVQKGPDPVVCPTDYNSECDQFYTVSTGDICWKIIGLNPPLTLNQLYAYNPSIHRTPECDNLMPGCKYCVHIKTTDSVPEPHQPNIKTGCQEYYQAVTGDYCYRIAMNRGIDVGAFMSWNPDVGSGCLNMLAGYWYCVKP